MIERRQYEATQVVSLVVSGRHICSGDEIIEDKLMNCKANGLLKTVAFQAYPGHITLDINLQTISSPFKQ